VVTRLEPNALIGAVIAISGKKCDNVARAKIARKSVREHLLRIPERNGPEMVEMIIGSAVGQIKWSWSGLPAICDDVRRRICLETALKLTLNRGNIGRLVKDQNLLPIRQKLFLLQLNNKRRCHDRFLS
jgi:hypothetical protein